MRIHGRRTGGIGRKGGPAKPGGYPFRSAEKVGPRSLPARMSQRLASILADRVDPSSSRLLCKRYIEQTPTEDTVVLEFVQREALDIENFGTNSWAPKLEVGRA